MKTYKVTIDGHAYTVQVEAVAEDSAPDISEKTENNSLPAADAQTKPEPLKVKNEAAAPVNNQTEATPKAGAGGSSVKAPMPGSILEVMVNVGDNIKDGDVLIVLEAMKMENELTASQAGTVAEILVKKGDTVNSGDPLIVLQ